MSDLANLIPEGLIPVPIGVSLGNAFACDWVNVGLAEMAWIVVSGSKIAAASIVCTPQKAYAAAGTGATALTVNVPIWAGLTIAGVPTPKMTRQADAVNYTTAATAGVHTVVFQIDPASLGVEGSTPSLGPYNFIGGTYVSLVADALSVVCYMVPRYAGNPLYAPTYLA